MTTRYSTDLSDRAYDDQPGEIAPAKVDIGRLLRLRWPLMTGVLLAVAIPACLAVWMLTPIEYTSSADFRFLSTAPRVMNAEQSRFVTAAYKNFVNTQIGLIQGSTVLSRVLSQPDIISLEVFEEETDKLSLLEGSITIREQRSSELVRVSCTMPDKEMAKAVLSEIVSQYMAYAAQEE